jgi:membrane-associated phospholipid phosphatase
LQFLFLALFGVLCGVSFFLDEAVVRFVAEHRTKPLKNLAGFISNYGDWPWLMLFALPFLIWAWVKKRPLMLRLVAMAMIASTFAGAAANTLRLTTGRTRPNNTQVEPGWYGLRHEGRFLLGKNKFSSFPSGHTATAFGFFAVLAFRRKRHTILWFVPAVLMGASRMVIDSHYLSDVCVGAWFGLIAAWALGSSRRFATCRLWKVS